MRPHPRIRKTIMWGGAVFVLAVVAVAAATTGRWCGWEQQRSLHTHWLGITRCALVYQHVPQMRATFDDPTFRWQNLKRDKAGAPLWPIYEWLGPRHILLAVPLWMPAALAAVTSAIAWRLDTLATRRAKLGACPTCSYPRAGIAPSAPCPECGSAAPQD